LQFQRLIETTDGLGILFQLEMAEPLFEYVVEGYLLPVLVQQGDALLQSLQVFLLVEMLVYFLARS
jgi:hypothetical protein